MADFPAMPFWTDAYLGDTLHLTLEEHGAYVKLLIIAWRSPNCDLPDDDKRLATMLGIGPKKWKSLKTSVWPFFDKSGGRATQKKQLVVRSQVERNVSQKRKAGKASSLSKSLKNNETDPTAVGLPLERLGNGKSTNQNQRKKEEVGGADAPKYAYLGNIVKLNQADFDRWEKNYPNILDLRAELTAADAYYTENKPKNGQWFFPVSNWMKRANNDALSPKDNRKAITPMGVNYGDP